MCKKAKLTSFFLGRLITRGRGGGNNWEGIGQGGAYNKDFTVQQGIHREYTGAISKSKDMTRYTIQVILFCL